MVLLGREPLVYLDYALLRLSHMPCSPGLRRHHDVGRGLLETHPVRHVYPTWSAQPHRGVGYAPVCVDCNMFLFARLDGSFLYNGHMGYRVPAVLPKTEFQRVKELKKMLIESKGEAVVKKVIDIALNDDHPMQMAALKLCMERALPVSLFEKTSAQRNAVNITISGIGVEVKQDQIINDQDIEDVEHK